MTLLIPCVNHTTFNWYCQLCGLNRKREEYRENRDIIITCELCKKDMRKVSFHMHKKTAGHLRQLANKNN